jgi:toxin ParE1/3/4
MRRLRILDAAAHEAAAAAAWYESQRPGLGTEFQQAVDAALDPSQEDVLPLSPVTGIVAKSGAKRLGLKLQFDYELKALLHQPIPARPCRARAHGGQVRRHVLGHRGYTSSLQARHAQRRIYSQDCSFPEEAIACVLRVRAIMARKISVIGS